MTEEQIAASLRTHIAAQMDRDQISGKLPEGTDAEVQQVFDVLVAGAHAALKHNQEWYRRLLEASVEDGDKSIKWFINESGKLLSNPQ
jgi:hypothetical protein